MAIKNIFTSLNGIVSKGWGAGKKISLPEKE